MEQQLIDADKAFSQLSQEKGMPDAFLHYADSSVIILRNGQFPIWGKAEQKMAYQSISPGSFTLTWEPLKAEVATSGDLGYTFGNWKMVSKNTDGNEVIKYGNYVSIWKKQPDGTWKYVLDTGTDTPSLFCPPKN